ncbi:alpha amylase, catalytic domain protein, partial [Ostertagia ostertagi]
MSTNLTLFQFFHWYYSVDGNLWKHALDKAPHLSRLGITHVWLPPAYKSSGGVDEPGYAVYDLYDLGEFDQKGTVRTRYGTKDEYLECIKGIQAQGMEVIADIVLNHKNGGDETEEVPVQQVNPENRNEKIGEPTTKEAHTKYYFPGRGGNDIPANKMYKLVPGFYPELFLDKSGLSGTDQSFLSDMIGSNGVALDKAGNLVFCQHGDHSIARLNADRSVSVLASHYMDKPFNSPNDLVTRSCGAIFFTDPPYGLKDQ